MQNEKYIYNISTERHSLKSKSSKLIILGHILAIELLLTKHISKNKSLLESKRSKNVMKLHKVIFFLNHRNC